MYCTFTLYWPTLKVAIIYFAAFGEYWLKICVHSLPSVLFFQYQCSQVSDDFDINHMAILGFLKMSYLRKNPDCPIAS